MAGTVKEKGCWTCKDRKIRCDRQTPTCTTCAKAGRACMGYGLRLSWPRAKDERRAIRARPPKPSRDLVAASQCVHRQFLNVFSSDVVLINSLLGTSEDGEAREDTFSVNVLQREYLIQSSISKNPSWVPFNLQQESFDLLSFYDNVIWKTATSANNLQIRSLVGRMSFTEGSVASYAVLQALLALAAMQTNSSKAVEFKSKAMHAFRTSEANELEVKYALQRIVMLILLSIYEILTIQYKPLAWAVNVCYAKHNAIATYTLDLPYSGDLAVILDWIYYHDVLSKFGLGHTKRRTPDMMACADNKYIMYKQLNAPQKTMILGPSACSLEVLLTLSQIFDLVLEMQDGRDIHQATIDKLERRLKYAKQEFSPEAMGVVYEGVYELGACGVASHTNNLAELYRLAALIYLHRAVKGTATSNPTLGNLVDEAFTRISQMHCFERTFPLFIIACEARTDLRRADILRVIDWTYKQLEVGSVGNMNRVSQFIERFWAQEDLDTSREVDYMSKMTATLSLCNGAPPFT